jgi:peptidoglycan/LPS O-acetylase OafA/YrhL
VGGAAHLVKAAGKAKRRETQAAGKIPAVRRAGSLGLDVFFVISN